MAMRRFTLRAAAAAALVCPALAQQRGQNRPPAPPKPAQTQAPQPPAPTLFPCRTEKEVCYIGVVVGNQLAILFTNAPGGETMDPKPVAVFSGAAGAGGETPASLDLGQHEGRAVMLTGEFDPKLGLTKAEVVDVAGPLLSFMIKSQASGPDEAQAPQGPPGKAPARTPRR